ncbi:MAG: xanthine dehydrogenase molybdenum-binding subunit XdhA [Lachnospiraceae bacterium]|nr:xanthine dehydrogenase molybdenum-binding subunit XdhA [Lachnospiraceae bacterium]
MEVGKSVKRVDALEKVTGRAKFTDDICPSNALIAKVYHAEIAHGFVKSIDIEEAMKVPGVIKILTCFDVPDYLFSTDGHAWDPEADHSNMDRHLLNRHIRLYGDDIAAVIAEDSVAADQALRAIRVEYEELPFMLKAQDAIKEDAPQLFEHRSRNICGETFSAYGDYDTVTKEEGLHVFDDWYAIPRVQHCHLENGVCFAYQEKEKITVVASTQIPHIVRRCVAQALGVEWGMIRVVKPYIGGGFGNKQDVLYEPLCAWLCTQVGGRCVKIDTTREETFCNTRVRHCYDIHIVTHVRENGTIAARYMEMWGHQGGYTSHGHGVTENAVGAFMNLYPCDACKVEAHSVFTNTQPSGAMRAYGFPQALFCVETQIETICREMGFDSLEFRKKNMMNVGFKDDFTKNEVFEDGLSLCIDKGAELFRYREKQQRYAHQTGEVRRGVGMAVFWYTSGVWPVSVETDTCHMILNQDGSVQVIMAETEIGQGADTAFSQMAADVIGVPLKDIHIVSTQDTDHTPIGFGAFASRQTFVGSFSIAQTGGILKDKILEAAERKTGYAKNVLDCVDGNIVTKRDGRVLISLKDLSEWSIYNRQRSEQLTAESTADVKANAFNYGCTFAEVEVDIPMCRVRLLNMLNVHDCGKIINPALAEAQVHGGMSMAIGYGLQEELLHDPKTGRCLNGNFLDYKLPTFMDHPRLNAAFVETVEPKTPFGNRSLGEPPAIGGAPAIRNAILAATGVSLYKIPMTPKVLYEAFRDAGLFDGPTVKKAE